MPAIEPRRTLKVANLHLAVVQGDPAINRKNLIAMAHEACDQGAKILVSPEMGLSGYSFETKKDILPYLEPKDGETGKAVSKFCRERGVFFVCAFGEKEPQSGMCYNAAFAYDPQGEMVCHYRKINAESRWACPGMPSQENLFITPWGMAAILICSDTYHSLPSRIAALKGADLLIVPANWPPSYLFPENIWRFRALENGMWLMAANRTGADKNFNCLKSKSYVIAPNGEVICGEENPNSQVMFADIPLNALGKFEDTKRKLQILADRKPWLYYRLYANLMFFKDLTGSLSLPKPNPFDLWFVAQGKNLSPLDYIETRLPSIMVGTGMVLPLRDYSDVELSRLETISKENGVIILAAREVRSTRELLVFENQERKTVPFLDTELPPLVHVGPAAILPVKAKDLFHPELALSAAKLGADLLLANEDTLGEYDRFTVSMRPIDQLAVAVCANDGAAIGLIPEGHVPGRGAYTQEGSHFTYTLDTRDTRQKHFQDRIDYPVLFESSEDRLKAFLKEGKNL